LGQNAGVTPTPIANAKGLSDTLLREIAATGGVKRYPANTVLINEGDTADTLFIILSGRVKVYAGNDSGKEVILNEHGPGEYVGEVPLDGGVRSASVMTLEPTTCALVTGGNLREFIATHPDFALHLIRNLILRLRTLTDSVKSLALDDVYSRVVGLLQKLAVPEGEHRAVPQRLTQQEIADRVGASREMVNRIFKDLTIGGYLSVKSGRIVLLKNLPAAW
jgi:CRP/FNR family cyclic AMP-dependent transcriptional regulator